MIAVGESRQPVSDVAGEIGPAPTMPAPKLTVGAVSLTDVTVTGGSEDMRELKRQIAKLQMEHRAMALALKHVKEEIAPLTSQTLYEYKLHEGEEEEGIIDRIVGLCAFPWNVAFTCTIPKCDRESFQVWDEEKPTYFGKFDVDMQNVLTDYCRRTDRLTEDENLSLQDKFFPGKRTQKEVTLSYERSKKYLIAFFMSIVWIIIASYFMVECAHGFGCHVGIPPFVMGVAVLAAGTSIPDALASMVVAEQGDGDMAVANAIGSNVFDICIGMGLPLIISQMVYAEPYPVTDTIPVRSAHSPTNAPVPRSALSLAVPSRLASLRLASPALPPLPAARRFSRGHFALACNTRRALPRSEDRGIYIDSQCANSVSRPAFAGFGHRRHVDYYHDCAGAGADGEQVDSNQEDGNLSSVPLCTLRWGSYPVPVRAPNRPFAAPFVAHSPSRITCGVSVRFEHVSTQCHNFRLIARFRLSQVQHGPRVYSDLHKGSPLGNKPGHMAKLSQLGTPIIASPAVRHYSPVAPGARGGWPISDDLNIMCIN